MLIPKGGDVYTASRLHELRLRPEDRGCEIATDVRIYYICPVSGAGKALKKIDPAVARTTR